MRWISFLLYYAYNHPVQHVAYPKKIYGWSIQFEMINLGIQRDAWEINGNSFGHDFPKVTIGKQILRPSYLKIRLTLLDSLIIFKKNMSGYDTKIVWTVQAFHGCIDTSMRWSRVCKIYTLNHAFDR